MIVHSAGPMESTGTKYWAEVPALAACMGEGPTLEATLERTCGEIEEWLEYALGEHVEVSVSIEEAL